MVVLEMPKHEQPKPAILTFKIINKGGHHYDPNKNRLQSNDCEFPNKPEVHRRLV